MKRLLRKGNPVARLIAMWVAFIMLLTPLYQHSGLKNDTKAAGAITYSELSVDLNAKEIATDGSSYYIASPYGTGNADKNNATQMQYFSKEVTVTFTTPTLTQSAIIPVNDQTFSVASDNFEVLCLTYTSGNIPAVLDYDVNQTSNDSATDNNYYAVYVRLKDQFKYLDSNSNNETIVESTTANQWTLQKLYKLVPEVSYMANNYTAIWKTSANGSYSEYANTPVFAPNTVKASVEEAGNIYLGEFKYYYAKYDSSKGDSFASYSSSEITELASPDDFDASAMQNGEKYIGWYSYSNGGETPYMPSGDMVTIDKVDPVLNGAVNIYDNKGATIEDAEPGVKYLKKGQAYWMSFKVTETNPYLINSTKYLTIKLYNESGVEEARFDIEAGASPYVNEYKEPFNWTINGTESFIPANITEGIYDVKVQLRDQADNGEEIQLTRINIIDPALKVTYKISDLSDVVDADNKLDSPTKLQSKVSVTVTSGNQLQSLSIFEDKNKNGVQDDDETAFVNKENLTGASKKSGLYTYEINYTIPSVADEGSYENVKLLVTDSVGSQTYTISGDNGFVYDCTNPVVTPKDGVGIYKWDGSSWQPLPADEIVNDDYNLDTTKDDKFKIVVDVQDDTSGIKSVTAYYNDKAGDRQEIAALAVDNTINTANTCYSSEELTTAQLNGFIANSTNGRLDILVEAIDNVGLNGIVGANPTLVIPDKDLRIDSATLTVGGSDTPVDLSNALSMDFDNKELFKLTITASSGYPINKIEIRKDVDYTDPNATGELVFDAISITENDYTQDSVTKRYSVTKEILVPNSIDADTLNLLLNDVYVRVYDNHTPDENDVTDYNVVSQELGNLLYDATKPVITDLNGDTFVKNDGKWYQALAGENYIEVDAKIATGPQSIAEESTFEDGKITYTIQGSAANDTESPISNGVVINTTDTPARVSATANVKVPESKNANGTTVTFNAVDKAGNELDKDNVIVRIVDGTNPRIQTFTVNGNSSNSIPLGKTVKIEADVWDNLAIDKVVIEVKQTDGTTYYSKPFDEDSINYNSTEITKKVSYEVTLPDGSYTASIKAYDKVGLETLDKTTNFMVDSTAPVVDVAITAGTAGKTNYFYSSNVTLTFTKSDKNGVNETIVDKTTGENLTNKIVWDASGQKGTYIVTGDGLHTIEISAKDATGNPAVPKSVSFIKDTVNPTVAATINGGIVYNDNLGVVVLTSNATTTFTVSEANEDVNDFNYQIIKAVPDEAVETGTYLKSALRSFTFADEAEYTINAFSVDMANRQGPTKTVRFRIDRTAPSINIGGIASGGTSSSAVTVSLNMQELYWNDASGTVEIYMKSGEGFGEELIDEITYTPTGRNTSIARTFSESGVYRIEFNAQDSAGHTSTASSTFTIDTEAPVVTLEGVSNYDVTDKDVVISSTITDKFYASKRVTITGTITDETGKVTPLTIDNYSATANPTTINETFSADGIYDLTINCVDVAGNSDSKSVHFIIDKSDPVIGDLSDIDGKILTSFEWDKDLDELVSDLTVCDVHMYLNGKEYNGEDAVADGSYVLLITAEDELGHIVEKSVEFVLDTKEPVFIVTGVEDGEKRIEPYNISVSLQLEEDTLTSVTLNGKVITINGNVATFDVTEIGEYKLYMEAVDEAGNVSSAEYEFELESENNFNIWIIIAIIAVLLLIIIFIVVKKRKDSKK